jgi:hypothetical protein
MARWLQGRELEVFEAEEVSILTDAELQVTTHGQVRWIPGARSIFDLFEETEKSLAAKRPEVTEGVIRKVTGIRPLAQLPKPKVETIHGGSREVSARSSGRTLTSPATPKMLILRPERGIVLPALHWPGGDREPILLAPGDGMNSQVAEARRLHDRGHPVLIVEVRDTGETKTRNWRFYGADSFIGHMLGRSWLAMRTEDLLVSARWLAETSSHSTVMLQATGETVPSALHARFLESGLLSKATPKDGLTSWRQLMTEREAYPYIHQAVHGALLFYDLPDLRQHD